jgi:hypothetical protein
MFHTFLGKLHAAIRIVEIPKPENASKGLALHFLLRTFPRRLSATKSRDFRRAGATEVAKVIQRGGCGRQNALKVSSTIRALFSANPAGVNRHADHAIRSEFFQCLDLVLAGNPASYD